MNTIALDSILSKKEMDKLKYLADEEGKAVEELVRQALKEMLTRKTKKNDLRKHSSFGIWKDETRSDEELLSSLGGNWKNFPLKDAGSD